MRTRCLCFSNVTPQPGCSHLHCRLCEELFQAAVKVGCRQVSMDVEHEPDTQGEGEESEERPQVTRVSYPVQEKLPISN
jgi:hypothetical protein